MRVRAALVLTAPVALLAALLVPVSSVSAVDGDEAPVVGNASLSPETLPYSGGTVHVRAEVSDNNAVATVTATVFEDYRELQKLNLGYADGVANGDIDFDPHAGSDAGHKYTVIVTASDVPLDGNEVQTTQALAGTVTQAAGTSDPFVSAPMVTPRTLPSTGGAVTIGAEATGDGVSAVITPADGTASTIELKPADGSGVEGVFDAPANTGTTAQTYAVKLTAGDETVDAGTITVAAPELPPLQVPDTVAFGDIEVGTAGLYGFVLRYDAEPGSPDADGTLTVGGADYAFADTEARSVRYHLSPGDTATVGLTFRPAEAGERPGTVEVTRDQAPKTQTVHLTGRGV